MSKMKSDLKRVLDALAFQDAADYLSEAGKNRVLGIGDAGAQATRRELPNEHAAARRRKKRIALITDGRGTGAPLAYAADACARQGAGLDVLLHGPAEAGRALLQASRKLGADAQVIALAGDDVEVLVDYICNHPSLVYLVGLSDDALMRSFAERVLPARGGRMHVPLVLIEDKPAHEGGMLNAVSM